ncbi:MAG: hypothetical protein J6B96_07455 [Agathobacter sp.]|nr:hypothetical protein [Agathobacter sp.]
MAGKTKKIIALVLALVVIITAIPVSAMLATANTGNEDTGTKKDYVLPPKPTNTKDAVTADSETEVTMADYKVIAESDTYKMHFYEPRLSIILENKKTGELIESTVMDSKLSDKDNATWQGYMRSAFVISAIVGTNDTIQVDLFNSPHLLDVTYTDKGFSAKVYFTKYEFGLTLEVSLEGDQLVVNIPDESIVEYKADNYIGTISVYPLMGYTYLGEEEGYMLIPDGNGALINLEDKEGRYTNGFSQMIYGEDAGFRNFITQSFLWGEYDTVVDCNQIIAPVFGMAHTNDQMAYLAVVEGGEERTFIEVQPNGAKIDYNRCFARFVLRTVYVQPLNQSNSGTVKTVEKDRMHTDLTVRYLLLEGDDANYSGMAVAYREYLLDNNLISQKDTSYKTRVDFLGCDQEEFLMGTTAVVMTTTEQMKAMYAQLQQAGVKDVLTLYKGWQQGGIYALPINKYQVDGTLGGNSALSNLIKESAEAGYDIYLYNDALRINARTNLTTFDAMKMVNKRTFKEEVNKLVYKNFYYLMPEKTQERLNEFVNSYVKSGVSNLAISGISNGLFSYSSRGNYYDRTGTAQIYADTLAALDEKTNLILEQPFAYLWNNTESFLDMPLGSSEYMYIDAEVPFLSMVLKGILPMYSDYVNFEADKTEFFLKMVESGVYPSFYLTHESSSALIYTNSSNLYSTQFDIYKDTVIEYDKELREVASKVEGAHILKHEKVEEDVIRVTYDNGVVIYVNYSENTVVCDGVTIAALSYKVGEK